MEQEPLQEEIVQENSELTEAKQNFLISDENSTITIMLVEKACEQYYNHFKKPNVPFSYIKFFIEEFKIAKKILGLLFIIINILGIISFIFLYLVSFSFPFSSF